MSFLESSCNSNDFVDGAGVVCSGNSYDSSMVLAWFGRDRQARRAKEKGHRHVDLGCIAYVIIDFQTIMLLAIVNQILRVVFGKHGLPKADHRMGQGPNVFITECVHQTSDLLNK
jgi:hypothetical protein